MIAFLDTTILVNILLNRGQTRTDALSKVTSYEDSLTPVYAIKELKAGALSNFVWFYNKIVQFSLAGALQALQKSALSPRRYRTATAIQAITVGISAAPPSLEKLTKKYGPKADLNEVNRDRIRLALRRIINKAWRGRRSVSSEVVQELSCYTGEMEFEESDHGLLSIRPVECQVKDCCLTTALRADQAALKNILVALESCPPKTETQRRIAVIKHLLGKPSEPLSPRQCRALGDAYFAFFAPVGCEIITTNIVDHNPLAASLNKKVVSP